MAGKIEARLVELKIELPAASVPVANYMPFSVIGHQVHTAGQVSRWNGEFKYVGAGEPGPTAKDLLEIGRPDLDWVKLAEAQGVEASCARSLDDLAEQLGAAIAERGPRLIEVMM